MTLLMKKRTILRSYYRRNIVLTIVYVWAMVPGSGLLQTDPPGLDAPPLGMFPHLTTNQK